MSMAIAGENKPGWIEGIHWDAMAFEAGAAPRLVRGVLSRMNSDLPDAISKVIGDERLLPTERDFIREKVLPVIEERRGFVAEAVKGRQSTVIELIEPARTRFGSGRAAESPFSRYIRARAQVYGSCG
jgi:serine/threonine-protein kinase HipA